jgi:hypothetical protein
VVLVHDCYTNTQKDKDTHTDTDTDTDTDTHTHTQHTQRKLSREPRNKMLLPLQVVDVKHVKMLNTGKKI